MKKTATAIYFLCVMLATQAVAPDFYLCKPPPHLEPNDEKPAPVEENKKKSKVISCMKMSLFDKSNGNNLL